MRYSFQVHKLTTLVQLLPFIIPITHQWLLPHRSLFVTIGEDILPPLSPVQPYAPVSTRDDEEDEEEPLDDQDAPLNSSAYKSAQTVSLSLQDKWRLVRPLLLRYMLPLCKSRVLSIPYSDSLLHLSLRLYSEFLSGFCIVVPLIALPSLNTLSTRYDIPFSHSKSVLSCTLGNRTHTDLPHSQTFGASHIKAHYYISP